jgi:GIY-YIG catalytic domain
MPARNSQEIPNSSGVYQIRCKTNGKIYLGSAVNLRARWDLHRRSLIINQHFNPHLQSAWNLYGAENFEFSILQYVEGTQLLATEQIWIERTGCINRDTGFNINWHATSAGEGLGLSWGGFRDPDDNPVKRLPALVHKGFIAPGGAVVRITNLAAFCRASGLCLVHMYQLKSGKRPRHTGRTWKSDADRAFDGQRLA